MPSNQTWVEKNNLKVEQRCNLFWMCFCHLWLNSREQQQHCILNQHCPKVLLNLTSFCWCVSRCSVKCTILICITLLERLLGMYLVIRCLQSQPELQNSVCTGMHFFLACSRLFELTCAFYGHHSLWLSQSTAVTLVCRWKQMTL